MLLHSFDTEDRDIEILLVVLSWVLKLTLKVWTARFAHSPMLHYACRSLLTENNGKNNAIAMGM